MSERSTTLPAGARMRLTAALRARQIAIPYITESTRSLPMIRESWSLRLSELPAILQRFEEAASPEAFETWTFEGLSASLSRLHVARVAIIAMLFALAPFEVRDLPPELDDEKSQTVRRAPTGTPTTSADASADILRSKLLAAVDAVIDTVLDAIEAGRKPPAVTTALTTMVPPVPTLAPAERGTALALAFGMATIPLDGDGSFSASRVFEAHKYANSQLLAYLLTHMQSLNLEPTDDVLSMVLTTGWIVQAPDPVLAWQTLRSMMLRLQNADRVSRSASDTEQDVAGDSVLDKAIAHLADREEALRQSRRVIQSETRVFQSTSDAEEAAHALADVYRRLVEGPVRQYGWAMRCLAEGSWTRPPMVGSLANGFAIDPWLNVVLVPKLIRDVRNGQAHEALEWDGPRGVYVVEGVDFDFEQVNVAVADCLSFALGCEAALVHWRGLSAAPGQMAPTIGEPGRMAEWRRVDALFGTNGLRINNFKFNALRLEAHIERLDREDINPSLQALVHARRLLPHVQSFAYYSSLDAVEPLIEVDAAALDATHPVWLHAREHFDKMPLSTFLPANLDARLRHESVDSAVRAVAWIAMDCALDAIDGLPPIWRSGDLWLVDTRIEHARLALRHTVELLERPGLLEVALDVLVAVQGALPRHVPFASADQVNRRMPILQLRALWIECGPAARMPGVDGVRGDALPGQEQQPRRRTTSPHNRWTTI